MKFYLCVISLNLFLAASFCCERHKTCRECIRDEKQCVWCADEKHKGVRCKLEVDAVGGWCSGAIQNPKGPNLKIKQNDAFSSEKDRIVQLSPQEIKFYLRPGRAVNFTFAYKRAKDYPLDFYFLIDGSLSMINYTKEAAEQSGSMYDMLRNMTNDIFIGMGTFVDKNAVPYTDNVIENTAYSFKNLLKLDKDYEKFRYTIRNMKFGKNIDEPESTMDALAQAMACEDEIGWRKQSRKVIVLNTDASYHVAGHGMLAGIIQPYDGNCYTKNGVYANELQMDYPSISILKHMALKKGFLVIFVVRSDKEDVYNKLKQDMGAYVTTYKERAKINEILGNIYESITESIQLQHSSDSKYQDFFKITYKPDCRKENCVVKINEELKFVGTFELLKYLDAESIPIDITIKGLNEKLHLDVNIIRECDSCKTEVKSASCSGNGIKTCGICECNDKWQGMECQCSLDEGLHINKERCMDNDIECSGRGDCICGKCKCSNNFKGEFCECNLQSCMLGPNNELCSGHGKCGETVCGECKCDDDWTGKDCSCSRLQTNCKEEGEKICNGFGECECNKCTCRQPSSWDTRKRDELCRPVQNEAAAATAMAAEQQLQCVQLQPCVLNDLGDGCKHVNITHVDTLPVNTPEILLDNLDTLPANTAEILVDNSDELEIPVESQELHITEKTQRSSVWIECPEFRADVGCYTRFVYKFNDVEYGVDVQVLSKLNCAETYYWAGGGCLIGLILIGLVTLVCWKILTNRRDRAEYDRFFKEVQSENPELVNPIFAPATVSFRNPAFRRSRHD